MAEVHNAIKYGTDIAHAAGLATGMDRGSGGVERTSETLQPTFDLWTNPEWAFLRGELLWSSQRLTAPAVAGEFGAVAITLPLVATGPWIATIKGVTGRTQVTEQALKLGLSLRSTIIGTLAAAALGNPLCQDCRKADKNGFGLGAPALEAWEGSDPASINSAWEQSGGVAGTTRLFYTTPYVIKPGFGIFVQGLTINLAFDVNIWGTIRRALPGELDLNQCP